MNGYYQVIGYQCPRCNWKIFRSSAPGAPDAKTAYDAHVRQCGNTPNNR